MPDFPHRPIAYCLRRGGAQARSARLRVLLREAAAEVRAAPRDVSRLCASGLSQLPHGRAAVAEGAPLDVAHDSARARRSTCGRRSSSSITTRATRPALLPEPLRGSGHPDARRRRRVEHDHVRPRLRKQDHADAAPAVSAFARAALLRLHLLLRLQGQQRRIQVDGAGSVRPADIPRRSSRSI